MKTIYRMSIIENVKRRLFLDNLRKEKTPYTVKYNHPTREYVFTVTENGGYTK